MPRPRPNPRRTCLILRTALLCALASSTGFESIAEAAQTPATTNGTDLRTLSLEALGDIEVTTTSKEPETVKRTPSAVFVLTSEDIRRSGATNLPDALRLVPGIQVSQIDGAHWAVGVRGFANQFSMSLLVLIDGRIVYTPLFAGVHWALQDVLLDDIDRIEVTRGPGATVWGANAVSGVINVITKSSKDTQGATATVGGGSHDHGVGSARYGGAAGSTFTYRIYGKGFQSGPGFHSDGQNFDDWWTARGGFRTDWSHAANAFTVQGEAYKGRDGQSVQYGSFAPLAEVTSYAPLQVSGGNLLARWRRDLGQGANVQVQAYYDRTNLLGPQIGESRNTFDADAVAQFAQLPRQHVVFGTGAYVSPATITQTVPTLDVTPHDQTESIYSAFAQDEIALVAGRLWLTVGTKLEHNSFTGLEVEPSGRLLWTLNPTHSLWTGVTRAVRMPSLLEEGIDLTGFLQAKPAPTFVRIAGNPNFKPEELVGYEAGYRGVLTPQLYVDVSVYYNNHHNLESLGALSTYVETSPAPPHVVLQFPYTNGILGNSRGIEIAPDWRPVRFWQLKGSYSYLRIDVENQPGNADTSGVATYEGSSPRHQVLVRSMLDLPRGWEFDQTIRSASALPAQKVDAYTAIDLRLGWQLARQLSLSITGENLTDANHVEFGHAPPPSVGVPRSLYAAIAWNR